MPSDPLLIAKGVCDIALRPRMANRHGLVAGATGTGKTVTLQTLAHAFSRIGVPVFLADVKGDLTGLARPGTRDNKKVAERLDRLGLGAYDFEPCPVAFWDVFGEQGLPMRATISEMGPLLLSRLLSLNDTQSGILTLAFRVADDEQLALLDLKDLRSLLQFVGENAKELRNTYGNVSPASVGAIQRSLLTLEEQGGQHLFGEPALALGDLMKTDAGGRGVVNILAADKLLHSPTVYASFLLWLLAELFETMPEVGDLDKPKLAFFFDEAHLLFNDSPKALIDKVEQVVRLIRSKGVGVYFVTQNPRDVPDLILGQLGNRVQHALRAFTPRDRKAVKAAAETFRANPDLDVETSITELGIGEALVSVLDDHGMPTPVERAFVVPPRSQIGPILADERQRMILGSTFYTHYTQAIDRESAFEVLQKRAAEAEAAKEAAEADKQAAIERKRRFDEAIKEEKAARRPASRGRETATEAMAKSTARSFGTSLGRFLSRNLLGVLGLGEGRRRR